MNTITLTKGAIRALQAQYRHSWIVGEQDGQLWTTDSFSAIKYDLPLPTVGKLIRRGDANSKGPDMTKVIPDMATYTECNVTPDEADETLLVLAYGTSSAKVNKKYFDNLRKALPQAQICIDKSSALAPVTFVIDGEIVGLLMPVRSN